MANKGWYVTQRSHACFGCEQLSMQRANVEKMVEECLSFSVDENPLKNHSNYMSRKKAY